MTTTNQQPKTFEEFTMEFDKDSFSPLLSRCSQENGWDEEYASLVLDEYVKFLYLARGKVPLVPSKPVDELWHQHILTTKKYQVDCERYVGRFVHHKPSFTADDRALLPPLFDKMKVAYESTFGKMPDKVWLKKGDKCTQRCDDDCGCAD